MLAQSTKREQNLVKDLSVRTTERDEALNKNKLLEHLLLDRDKTIDTLAQQKNEVQAVSDTFNIVQCELLKYMLDIIKCE